MFTKQNDYCFNKFYNLSTSAYHCRTKSKYIIILIRSLKLYKTVRLQLMLLLCSVCANFHSILVCQVQNEKIGFTFYLVVKSTSKCYDTVTGKYYREAELWQRDECTSCYCGSDRKPECTETACPPLFCETPLKIKQRCCPVCPDTIQQGKDNYIQQIFCLLYLLAFCFSLKDLHLCNLCIF